MDETRTRMQVDTHTTIFDQVPPISASINIKQEPNGETKAVQGASNGAKIGQDQE